MNRVLFSVAAACLILFGLLASAQPAASPASATVRPNLAKVVTQTRVLDLDPTKLDEEISVDLQNNSKEDRLVSAMDLLDKDGYPVSRALLTLKPFTLNRASPRW